MISTQIGATDEFLNLVQQTREDLVGTLLTDQINQGWTFGVDPYLYDNPDFLRYLARRLVEHERDMIYRSVIYSSGSWTTLRSTLLWRHRVELFSSLELAVKVEAYANDHKVYVPVYEHGLMPHDVFPCSWCGGHTKNDKRGHCAGCGGPRNDLYLDKLGG